MAILLIAHLDGLSGEVILKHDRQVLVDLQVHVTTDTILEISTKTLFLLLNNNLFDFSV
jgi:hypothetical protein